MTTNFYLKEEYENLYPFNRKDEPRLIGKRAAAGYYCWNCRHTLMYSRVYGTKFEVPDNSSIHSPIEGSYMLKRCPTCGLKAVDEGFESSCGRELGFKEGNPIPEDCRDTCAFRKPICNKKCYIAIRTCGDFLVLVDERTR